MAHDGKTFALLGDVRRGHIDMAEVVPLMLGVAEPVKVRTVDETSIAVSLAGPEVDVLSAIEEDEQGEEVTVRPFQVVPLKYLHIMMGKMHRPLDLWTELAGTIIGDGSQAEMAPLLKWLQVAVSLVRDDDDDEADPPIQLGREEETAFPAWRSDALQDFRQSLLEDCLLYTSPSPRDGLLSRMPSSA